MTYLLDTQVVSYFLQARKQADLAAVATAAPCAIVEAVRDELASDPTRGSLFQRWLPNSHLQVMEILVGSPADVLLTRLRIGVPGDKDLGERASIALAATQHDLVFTGMDKGAMWIALRELWSPGERLISLPVFLRRVVEGGVLGSDVAGEVMRRSNQDLPTWWADWRAVR